MQKGRSRRSFGMAWKLSRLHLSGWCDAPKALGRVRRVVTEEAPTSVTLSPSRVRAGSQVVAAGRGGSLWSISLWAVAVGFAQSWATAGLVDCCISAELSADYFLTTTGLAVKVTIDSNEPLTGALRVLGAVYDVTVVVAEDGMSARKPPVKGSATPSSPKASVRRARKKLAAQPAASVSNVDVRSWAQENGMTVSNRGRLPARVVAAYREAHRL